MKCFFSLILFISLSTNLFSKDFEVKYIVKTKGIFIGTLNWKLKLTEELYETSLELKKAGALSVFYNFKGSYETIGEKTKDSLSPLEYKQSWTTNKKQRDVRLTFENFKVTKLVITPEEKEAPRIKYKNLKGYNDPVTSFLNILLYNKPSYTIDGRRTYLLTPVQMDNYKKILIEKYKNIWADHNRNDLEYLEIFNNNQGVFPQKINIKFKGSVFVLSKS